MNRKPIKILLVEDNEGDILLTTEALEECKVGNELKVLRNGNDALNFLVTCSQTNKNELPDLILLDINLPKKNGHEVLQSAKNHPDLKHIPIIILTTSSSELDILKAYQEHCNCYIIKPLEVSEFLNVTSKIEEFWFNVIRLPNN
ncbi:MAG: response regulator [Algoriphagus sp.]|jgi:CheY-like chemotaxis protein|uniref:response regulator n=1 Tax=Algoriphagus sp. TaxID=1872435 RepID=UPI002725AD40|nr:response regulator [Algoriphagus sp.]MDO8965606.1 response regulator [Algoriphagus sp.]MDP2041864.1 response regulator [Algoriphagus sp.]MDP3198215.1 response regulator [Algoriphagus sp.]MDP3473567.1 response regulator [Algoriphagus sp.]